jgi:glucuronate isomerase
MMMPRNFGFDRPRVDCAFLARLVAEHRLELDEAFEVAHDLAYRLAKSAYKL